MAEITRDQWDDQHITIIGLKPKRGSNDTSFQIKTSGLISALHRRSDAPYLTVTIRSMDTSSPPLIKRRLFIERSRPNPSFKYEFFATEEDTLEYLRIQTIQTRIRVPIQFLCVLDAFMHPRSA